MDMPPIGLGCSPQSLGSISEFARIIELGLDLGYRLLDTAEVYGTEPVIGEVLRRHRVTRDRLFIVSKVWQTNHSYHHVIAACEQTLRNLGLSFVDLYLVHSPEAWQHRGPLGNLTGLDVDALQALSVPVDSQGRIQHADVSLEETWDAMQELRHRGLARAIGVSNFLPEHIAALGTSRPQVNQVAHHPFDCQADLVRFCQDQGIHVMAHSPLSAAGLLQHSEIRRLAEKYSRTPAQIILRWNVDQAVTPIPGTSVPSHLAENLDIFGFVLRPDDLAVINALNGKGQE